MTLRVVELLSLVGDDTEERAGIPAGDALESHVHPDRRLHHEVRRGIVAQGDERRESAERAARGGDQGRRYADIARGTNVGGRGRDLSGDHSSRLEADVAHLRAGILRGATATTAESGLLRGRRRQSHRRRQVDEAGVDGSTAQVDDARVTGRRYVRANGFDEPVPDDDRAFLDRPFRDGLDPGVGERPGT